jgi:hypothetical protein
MQGIKLDHGLDTPFSTFKSYHLVNEEQKK